MWAERGKALEAFHGVLDVFDRFSGFAGLARTVHRSCPDRLF